MGLSQVVLAVWLLPFEIPRINSKHFFNHPDMAPHSHDPNRCGSRERCFVCTAPDVGFQVWGVVLKVLGSNFRVSGFRVR